MNSSLWKYIAICSLTAHTIIFSTFIARLYPTSSAIIFILIIFALVILIQFHPDIAEEDLWVKGVLIAVGLLGILAGTYDAILDYFYTHTSEIQQYTLIAIGLLGMITYLYFLNRSDKKQE